MVMTRERNAGRGDGMKIDNRSIERVEEFKYLGATLTDQNSIQEEITKLWDGCKSTTLMEEPILMYTVRKCICLLSGHSRVTFGFTWGPFGTRGISYRGGVQYIQKWCIIHKWCIYRSLFSNRSGVYTEEVFTQKWCIIQNWCTYISGLSYRSGASYGSVLYTEAVYHTEVVYRTEVVRHKEMVCHTEVVHHTEVLHHTEELQHTEVAYHTEVTHHTKVVCIKKWFIVRSDASYRSGVS
jgi:hypothetical protein